MRWGRGRRKSQSWPKALAVALTIQRPLRPCDAHDDLRSAVALGKEGEDGSLPQQASNRERCFLSGKVVRCLLNLKVPSGLDHKACPRGLLTPLQSL